MRTFLRAMVLSLGSIVCLTTGARAAVKDFRLTIQETTLKIGDVTFPVWAFNGQVPGPELRVTEGDLVRVTVTNKTRNKHTVHWHGLNVPNEMDGVPGVTQQPIEPDSTFVYEFIATPAGTHMYHCHVNSHEHVDMGLYGPFIVEPRKEPLKVDKEYTLMLDEWDSTNAGEAGTDLPIGHPRRLANYNFFTINGKSFPETPFITVKTGERVRVRMSNVGYQVHAMHLHGHHFLVTHKDGSPLKDPIHGHTLNIAPGEMYDLVFTADNPGRWVFHCHVIPHVTEDGEYPHGMLTLILYEDLPEALAKKLPDPTPLLTRGNE